VSTEEQNLDMQIQALLRAGVHADNIHTDKVSALALKRPGLQLALKDAVEGDVIVVWKLDRFGRSVRDVLNRIEELEDRGVGFRSLTETFDTTTPMGLMILTMLAGFAQFERDMTAARTKAGIARAKENGKTFGAAQLVDVKAARAMFRQGMSLDEVRAHFPGARGNKIATRQAMYRYFSAPVIWLLQGKPMRDYPRKITRAQIEKAKLEAKKK
jgi:DNA invertase Pin-like site-specific DNA recombinase